VLAKKWQIEHIVGYDDAEFSIELDSPFLVKYKKGVWTGTWYDLGNRPYYFEVALHRPDPIHQERYHAIEEAMLKDVNEQRARHGLRPLLPDLRLFKTARSHCMWMTSNGMVHGSYPVAENIAMGQRSNREVINTWMNSSGHRANILNPGYRCFGCSAFRIGNTTYWCQQFTQ
jgi:uncharacterized protein YkwD